MDQGYLGQWQRVCARLRSEFGDAAYNSWLRPLKFEQIDDGMAHLQAPTRFMRDWVLSHYGERIRAFWQAEDSSVREIEITVHPVAGRAPVAGRVDATLDGTVGAPFAAPGSTPAAIPATSADPQALRMGSSLDARYQFDSFVVGKSNELAYAAARRV
ncbi:MAG: chromosomal replication initiator protein DnaA, partial [Rhodospirillaceae bacterium]|nr:chromosomal replication initiator protein DnaA [Rhodospirillaceae bacterium]